MGRSMRLQFESSIENIQEINQSFASATIRICHTGTNRNRSKLEKQVVEAAIPSMFNCPVVCNYDVESDSIGGHDMDVVRDDKGGLHLINLTDAVGVIPSTARYWWSTVVDQAGIQREYLNAEAVLWKRTPAYQKILADGMVGHSMEIEINRGYMADGIFHIEDFIFTAFCLLGERHTPCFEDSALELFDHSEMGRLKASFAAMMDEYNQYFSMAQPSQVAINESQMEGGDEPLDEKKTILSEFGVTEDQLDFEIDEMSEEQLREKLNAIYAGRDAAADVPEASDEKQTDGVFALESQIRDGLYEALSAEKVERPWGLDCRYYMLDYDSEAMEVYCEDSEDWKLYGFKFTMNGDDVEIDFESKTRKKFAFVDFDHGEQSMPGEGIFAKAVSEVTELQDANKALEKTIQGMNDTYTKNEAELNELRQFKANAEETAARAIRDEILDKFEDLVDTDEFVTLKNEAMNYSAEELEDKCFSLRGRKVVVSKFTTPAKAPKIPVPQGQMNSGDPYGDLFIEYGVGQN